jgi:hypothetical protein
MKQKMIVVFLVGILLSGGLVSVVNGLSVVNKKMLNCNNDDTGKICVFVLHYSLKHGEYTVNDEGKSTVIIRNEETGYSEQLEWDYNEVFYFSEDVPVGFYNITVSREGYKIIYDEDVLIREGPWTGREYYLERKFRVVNIDNIEQYLILYRLLQRVLRL